MRRITNHPPSARTKGVQTRIRLTVGFSLAIACLPLAGGCGSNAPRRTTGGSLSQSARDDVAADAIDALNSLAETDSFAAAEQIVKRLNSWAREPEIEGWSREPLLDELPPALRKLAAVERLADMHFDEADSEQLRQLYWLRGVARGAGGFKPVLLDATDDLGISAARAPRSLAWADRLLDWKSFVKDLSPADREDLEMATRLFDWTVCHIQIEPPTDPADDSNGPDNFGRLPWHALLLGKGEAVDRAWVFCLLARQRGIDAVILALPDKGGQPRPWAVGALIADQLYLYDFELGLPIPGPGGRGIATLAQVAADDGLLRAMDVAPDQPYWATSANAARSIAWIEASPIYLSRRMAAIQSEAVGDQKFVFYKPASPLAARLKKMPQIASASLWTLPFERLARRRGLDRLGTNVRSREQRPFKLFVLESVGEKAQDASQQESQADKDFRLKISDKNAGKKTVVVRPLYRGRVRHLLGAYSGDDGAVRPYMDARLANYGRNGRLLEFGRILASITAEQRAPLEQWKASYLARLTDAKRQELASFISRRQQTTGFANDYGDLLCFIDDPAELERLDVALEAIDLRQADKIGDPVAARQLLDVVVILAGSNYDEYCRQAEAHASYWLGLAANDSGQYDVALDWLVNHTLKDNPKGPRSAAARYNAARAYEGRGELDEAIAFYRADDNSPQSAGSRLRAKWLESRARPASP